MVPIRFFGYLPRGKSLAPNAGSDRQNTRLGPRTRAPGPRKSYRGPLPRLRYSFRGDRDLSGKWKRRPAARLAARTQLTLAILPAGSPTLAV